MLNYQRVDPHQDSIDIWKTPLWLDAMRTNPQHDHPGNMVHVHCSLRGWNGHCNWSRCCNLSKGTILWQDNNMLCDLSRQSHQKIYRTIIPSLLRNLQPSIGPIYMGLSKHRLPKNQMMSSFIGFLTKFCPWLFWNLPRLWSKVPKVKSISYELWSILMVNSH